MSSINANTAKYCDGAVERELESQGDAERGTVVPLRRSYVEMDQVVDSHAFIPLSGRIEVPAPELPAETAALAVDSLSHVYGAIVALDRVSFSVVPGELVIVVGYSGSGKSTLLRMIAGLERPQAGRIAIDGETVTGPGAFVPPEARGVGMMFQDYALFPHLTVLKNVMFGLRGHPRGKARLAAEAALAQVGLADRGRAYPHMLSGGEQQRVALARAIVPEPRLLLMDEPFSNLDRSTHAAVRDETISVLRENGATVVLVTHDHDDAMRCADRIVLMQAGQILQSGHPKDLYGRPASLGVARYFSEFNEINGTCRGGTISTVIGDFPGRGLADGDRATVCIRRADIGIAPATRQGIAGRVVSRHFLGDAQLVDVLVPGLGRPLQVEAPPQATTQPGDVVTLTVEAERALVFG